MLEPQDRRVTLVLLVKLVLLVQRERRVHRETLEPQDRRVLKARLVLKEILDLLDLLDPRSLDLQVLLETLVQVVPQVPQVQQVLLVITLLSQRELVLLLPVALLPLMRPTPPLGRMLTQLLKACTFTLPLRLQLTSHWLTPFLVRLRTLTAAEL
jgi:hypothetical protein